MYELSGNFKVKMILKKTSSLWIQSIAINGLAMKFLKHKRCKALVKLLKD